MALDPHKWLFVPLDFSALYVRRPEALRRLHRPQRGALEGAYHEAVFGLLMIAVLLWRPAGLYTKGRH